MAGGFGDRVVDGRLVFVLLSFSFVVVTVLLPFIVGGVVVGGGGGISAVETVIEVGKLVVIW